MTIIHFEKKIKVGCDNYVNIIYMHEYKMKHGRFSEFDLPTTSVN